MAPRDTRTGGVLEQMELPALQRGGYSYQTSVNIGQRIGGGRHILDILVNDQVGRKWLVSLKWQQVSGTAEQKVPFEAICLAEAIRSTPGLYEKAYIVLGGPGWKLRDFYIGGGLKEYLRNSDLVDIRSLEDFVAKANNGQL